MMLVPTTKKMILALAFVPITWLLINTFVVTDNWKSFGKTIAEPNFGLSDYGLCPLVATSDGCTGGKVIFDIFTHEKSEKGCNIPCRGYSSVLLLYILLLTPSVLSYLLLSRKVK